MAALAIVAERKSLSAAPLVLGAAGVKTVAADGHPTEREVELLRAIAETLDCPTPPFVEALRGEGLAQNA